jgi:hypothetical protein
VSISHLLTKKTTRSGRKGKPSLRSRTGKGPRNAGCVN